MWWPCTRATKSGAPWWTPPCSAPLFVLVCDMIGRVIIFPYELPIELIVGILGSLVFIGLLFYRLKYGRKAIRLGSAGTSCCSAMPNLKGGADL